MRLCSMVYAARKFHPSGYLVFLRVRSTCLKTKMARREALFCSSCVPVRVCNVAPSLFVTAVDRVILNNLFAMYL